MCEHQPACPAAEDVDHDAARIRVSHPEQGWNLLCNGVVVFDDMGEMMPSGRCSARPSLPVPCRRPDALARA